jgi:hypothetical protein
VDNPDNLLASSDPVTIIPSPPVFVVSKDSIDGDIKTEIDPTSPEYDPQNDSFTSQPDPLPIDSFGRLAHTIRAERMDIQGTCRLCHAEVKSHQADSHLLDCRGINQTDTDDFAYEYVNITNNTYQNIISLTLDYSECIMHDDELTAIFSNLSTSRQFFSDLESLLDRKAIKIYKQLGIHGQQKRFNILRYD